MKQAISAIAAAITLSLTLHAQDTRTVTEPKIPASCTVLKAQLSTVGGTDGIAAADEARPDTARIQAAINTCGEGKAVELAADGSSTAFLTGPIELKKGVTLLIDKGVTLFASRVAKDYEVGPGTCGINKDGKNGCNPLIYGKDAPGAAIMGDGIINGRGGSKILVDGKPGRTWWQLGDDAKTVGHQQNPRLIIMDHCDNFTLYRMTLKNAPFFHVSYSNGDGFTVWGLKIDTPSSAKNTDGVDPSGSKNITVTQSYIRDGDDNIAIKAGNGPITNMTVIHNHFYYGHGMSIGSETTAGLTKLRVSDLSLDGTDAGIRIKSQQAYGGLVRDAVYEDICIRNSKNPILLDTNYSANPKPGQGLIPVYQDIVFKNVRIEGGGKIIINGFDTTHRIGVTFDGVTLDSPASYKFAVTHADVTFGPGPVNFKLPGTDSTARGAPGSGSLPSCAEKFVPFPE